MTDFFAAVLLLFIGIFFGFVCAIAGTNDGWEKDCQKIGAHLTGSTVYLCELKTVKP